NTDILGILLLVIVFGKKQNLNQLHKMAHLINSLENISQIAFSPQLLSALSSLDTISPLISSLSNSNNFEEYADENQNALF
ncbi:MAG: hypothetical protein IKU53_02760, partial [Firmicutes bacterium]|nr:hypothetical protein [Bacillota bacterium]